MAVGSAYLFHHERAVIQNGSPRLGRSCPWGGYKRVGAPQETYTKGRAYGDGDHELLWNADHHAGHGLPETHRSRGGAAAGAGNQARGTLPRHPTRQQRRLQPGTSKPTIAAAVPAIGRRLHSTARRQPQRTDQSIESLFST